MKARVNQNQIAMMVGVTNRPLAVRTDIMRGHVVIAHRISGEPQHDKKAPWD